MANGNEGTDTLTGVEVASFAEGPFTISVIGGNTRVNTFTPEHQGFSSIARLTDGGYVVMWQSMNQDGHAFGIFGQRYAANGAPQGNEFLANTTVAGDQIMPSVAALPNGGYVAVWRSYNVSTGVTSIVAQQYAADNAKVGSETTIISGSGINPEMPSVAALTDGSYVVVWNQGASVLAQHYTAGNAPSSGVVTLSSNTNGWIGNPSVAPLPGGGYVVAWEANNSLTQTASIFAQQYAANDTPVGSPVTTGSAQFPMGWVGQASIATLPDGGYMMTWLSGDSASNTTTLLAQQYAANNVPVNPPVTVSSTANTSGWMGTSSVATLPDGSYVVTWMLGNPANNTTSIIARQYDANGIAKGGEFIVSTATTGQNFMPSIAALGDGGFMITWEAMSPNGTLFDVYSQRYDANGNPSQQTVQLKSQNVLNAAPQLTNTKAILIDGSEDTVYIVKATDLLTGWTDAEQNTLSIANLASDHGTVTDNSDGTFKIAPDANYNGWVTLSYGVSDGTDTTTTKLGFNLTAVNDAPQLTGTKAALAEGSEGAAYTVKATDLLIGWTDAELNTLSIANLAADHGAVTDNGDGTYKIVPDANYSGWMALSYDVSDGTDATTTALGFNLAQNLGGISTVVENTVPSTEGGIQGDGNGDGILDSQQNDVASLPTLDTNVWATLDTDTISVPEAIITNVQNIPAPQDLPTQASLPYGVFSFNLESLASGATAPMSVYLTGTWAVNPNNQSQWINSDTGDVINGYWKQSTIDLNWYNIATSISVVGGKLKIDFNLTDGDWADKDGLVNGTIVDPGAPGFNNNAPVATDDTGSVDEDKVLAFSAQDLLANDADPDGDNLAPSLVNAPLHGILSQLADGTYTYTPDENYNGTDSFSYRVNDGLEDSNVATVNITVKAVNDAPTGATTGTLADGADGADDKIYPISTAMLLQGFTDADGDSLSVVGLTATKGTLQDNESDGWNFTPGLDYNGEVTLSYTINDGQSGITDTIIRTFNLIPANDDPVAKPDTLITDEDHAFTVNVVANDDDADGDPLSVLNVTQGAHGVVIFANDSVTYTPDQNYHGTDSFSYTVSDGQGGIDIETVNVTVNSVNDAPVAVDDTGSVDEDKVLAFSVQDLLANDADPDGDNLAPSLVNAPLHGILSQLADGTYTYTPDENYNGTDSFSYRVNDGLEDSNVATVNIVVNAVNDIPQAIDDSDQISEDATIIVSFDDLMANDIDVDGTAKTIIAVDTTSTAGHAVIDTTNRTISYSADADEFDLLATGNTAIDSFKYTLQGSSGEIDTAIVTINVLGVNDGNLNIAGTVQPDTLTGTPGEDRIKGNNGNDIIDGGEGADELLGENGDDNLTGGNSIDKLFGGNGNDKLNGGNGNDWLNVEKGNDILTGGLGSDVFLFAKSGGNDIITDFTHGADKIQIAADIGIVNFNQIKITGGTDSSGVVYTTINLGSGGQVTLTGVPSSVLDATDFIFPV